MKTGRLNRILDHAAAVTTGYVVLGVAWVLLCDRAIDWLLPDPAAKALAHLAEDLAFLALTALLLYGLLRLRAADARTRAQLQAAEQRFLDIVNTAGGIVWEADAASFDFTFVSENAERLLGYRADDWETPGFWMQHLHPDDQMWAFDYCLSRTRQLQAHDFEYRFIAGDGRTVWLHDIATVVEEEGAPRWLRGILVDITARRQAEKLLDADRRSMRDLLGSMLDGYWRFDIRGNLLDVNQTYCRQSGYTREELLALNARALEAQLTDSEIDERIQRARADGHARFITRHRRKDGSIWHVEISATYRDIGLGEFFVFLRDVGEQVSNQEELARYRSHLEELVSARTHQLRALSAQLTMTEERERRALAQDLHDNLSQLLAVIKIRLTSLAVNVPPPPIAQIVDLVDQADRSVRSITLQLSPPVLQALGLVPALEWLADQIERDYGLTVHVDSGLCGRSLGKEINAVLFRCTRELLINVAKHAGAGEASVSCMCRENLLSISVSDDGCGFDPTTSIGVVADNHGFGLSSIGERIGSIGGAMDVDSRPGSGATITLSLHCPCSKGNGSDGSDCSVR